MPIVGNENAHALIVALFLAGIVISKIPATAYYALLGDKLLNRDPDLEKTAKKHYAFAALSFLAKLDFFLAAVFLTITPFVQA